MESSPNAAGSSSPSSSSSSPPPPQPAPVNFPKDASLIALIMQSLSIDECEPQVIPQLLEYMYKHVTDTLISGTSFAEYVGRSPITELSLHDIRFAIQAKACHAFSGAPSRELLLEMATRKNAEPLPLLSDNPRGLRLPPDEHCLLGQLSQPIGITVPKASSSSTSTALRPGST